MKLWRTYVSQYTFTDQLNYRDGNANQKGKKITYKNKKKIKYKNKSLLFLYGHQGEIFFFLLKKYKKKYFRGLWFQANIFNWWSAQKKFKNLKRAKNKDDERY